MKLLNLVPVLVVVVVCGCATEPKPAVAGATPAPLPNAPKEVSGTKTQGTIWVVGEVERPAKYKIADDGTTTLGEVLTMAGGPTLRWGQLFVSRTDSSGAESVYTPDIKVDRRVATGPGLLFIVKPGDRIWVDAYEF